MKRWPVVTITPPAGATPEQWEIFSARATAECGALGIEEIAGEAGPRADAVPARANVFFAAVEQGDAVPAHLAEVRELARLALGAGAQVGELLIDDQDWGANWRQYFRRTRVAERLWVAPPWEAELPKDAPKGAILVQIYPGQAFGTGTHASTRLCMRMLERHVAKGQVLLDVGAGSGILSIAAVRLGAAGAIGLEMDPICEENFVHNAGLNGVERKVQFLLGKDPRLAFEQALLFGMPPPDLIVCNMLQAEFEPLLKPMHRLNRPMILSGYLEAEAAAVGSIAAADGWKVKDRDVLEDWAASYLVP